MADSVLDMLRQKQNDSVLEYLEQSRRPVEATPSGSEFGKGLASASAATAAGLRAFAANLAENFAPEWSKSQLKEINRLTASAQANAPRVTDLRQIGDASDLGDYIMGGLGQAVPSITTALVGSRLGIRGLNAAGFKLNPLAAGMVGGTVGMLPQEAGEAAVTMYNDPVAMANTTAAERTALMLGKGGINAALESIVPTMMGQKVLGGAAKLIRPGFKPAIGHAAKEMGKAGMYEAGTEAAQQVTGQAFHHLANPNEDLLAGGWDIANAAAQGFFPGAVMGGAGAGADILKSNLTQTIDKNGSVIPGGLASTLRGAKDDAHQAGVAGGERSGSAAKSLYERVSGWADRLAGSNKDVETRRSAVLDSLHPEQQRIRDLIAEDTAKALDRRAMRGSLHPEQQRIRDLVAPYFMNDDDLDTAYASARDLILASRHSLESKDFVPLDALSMFKPGKEGEGLATLARYMKHVGMIDNDETLGITKALKRRDIWRELLALNIDPKYGELTTAQLDDIAGNLELALMSSSGQLGFSSEYGFSGDYSEPDQVFQQGMLDLFGSKARHVREMIDKYDLHPRTGVKSQLGGLGSVGEQQDAAGVTPNDGAGTNAYGDAVGEAEDFGSDAVLDDGDTAPEFSDRLREFDSEDSDKESIKFDDLDKWFTKKEMPWSDEQLPATDTPNGQKLRAARISQNANMMRVINKQGESTLVPDDGIYLKRGNKLIDKETGAYRGPEIQRVTARTLIEKAREAAQHSDWTHDALTNPESLLSDFLRGLSMIIDAGQFTSLGTVKQGKVSGVGKEMKFEELYRINLDDKLYDTRAAALEAAKKLDKPAQTAQKGDKWVVQLTNSQEVLNKKTGTFDSIVSALKHIPDTLELMPGITVGDAKKALTAKMRKEGYTGPVSEKDLIAEGMKPRKAFKQAQFLNHPKTFTYTSRKQQPVAELAHEYSVIDQQIKALGDDASPSAAFQIKGLSALQSKLYDEIVRRLREAGEVDQGSSFVEIQDLVNDVVSHPEGWTSLDPELDFEDPKRKNYSLAQVEHKPDFSPPRNAPIIAAQVAPTESAARAYAETTGGRAVHNPETGEWMVVAGLSEKKYTEAELDSIKRVKTTKAGGYSPQSQTKTKDLRDSSKDGKDITRNKWVPEGLPQELDTFRKPKKTEANAIPEDHRTPGDIESDMLDIRKFDEETDEPLHEDRGAIRKHAQTIGEQLDALEDNLKKLRAEGAHKKHIENAERQLAALQATADEAAKAVDVFKDLRSSLRFGESTEPGASERALKEAGAPRHIIEEARKNQTDRAALIDQAEELVLRLLSASSLLGPKDSPVATGKLTKEIYDAIRLNKPLDRFQVRVQRHLRRAINEARKSRRAVGEQKTSIADTINMVADETNLTLYKVPPPEQLAAIMEFIQQVTNGAMTLTSEKVIGALKRAAGFDATYLGFGLEDTLRQVMTKAGITVPPKFGKQPRKLVLAPSKKEAPVKEAPKQAPKQAPAEKAGTYDNPIIGDIWAQDGFKVVSTNLGGVHGRGLAKQAKDKGLINNLNKNFESSPLKNKVITLAVKGNAPETAKVPGRAFSEQVVGGNLELLKSEVRKLIKYARANPGEKFFLPYIGLGFGEGNAADIKPVLEFAAKEPNIFMVAKDQATVATYADSFKPGVRRDATTRGERGADAASAISAKPDANDYGMSPDANAASDDLTDEVEAIRQQNRKDAIKLLKSLGGIGTKELSDITGEAKRRNDVPVGLLIKNPKWGLDELGRILASHGFLTEDQGEDVESVRDFLRDVLTGQGVTRLGTEDQLYLNFDVKHNKQSTVDEASKTDNERRGPSAVEHRGLREDFLSGMYSNRALHLSGVLNLFDVLANMPISIRLDSSSAALQSTRDEAKKLLQKIQTRVQPILKSGSAADKRAAVMALSVANDKYHAVIGATKELGLSKKIDEMISKNGANLHDVLSVIAASSQSDFTRTLAKALLKTTNSAIRVVKDKDNHYGGDYSPATATISMSAQMQSGYLHMVMHESVHAATLAAIRDRADIHEALFKLMDHVSKSNKDFSSLYGATNTLEFLAEGMTNPYLQELLKKTPPVKDLDTSKLSSAWDSFVDLVRSLLNIPKENLSAMTQLLDISGVLMKQNATTKDQFVHPGDFIQLNMHAVKDAFIETMDKVIPQLKSKASSDLAKQILKEVKDKTEGLPFYVLKLLQSELYYAGFAKDLDSGVKDFMAALTALKMGVLPSGTDPVHLVPYKSGAKHNKQSAKQRDIRAAFGAIDEASKTDDVLRGRDLISMALHHIERSDAPDAQKWSARQKVLRAESELRRKAMMQDAAQHEQNITVRKNAMATKIHNELGKEGFAATHDSPIKHEGKFDWRKHQQRGEGGRLEGEAIDEKSRRGAAKGAGTYLSTDDGVHLFYKNQFSGSLDAFGPAGDMISDTLYSLREDGITDPKELREGLLEILGDYLSPIDDYDNFEVHEAIKIAKRLSDAQLLGQTSPTYQVTVKAKQEEIMNWDAPISEQSDLVKKALASIGEQDPTVRTFANEDAADAFIAEKAPGAKATWSRDGGLKITEYNGVTYSRSLNVKTGKSTVHINDPSLAPGASIGTIDISSFDSGEELYNYLAKTLGSQTKASDYLQSLGIVGHKYAASGGRNDKFPNYVIYDDSRIETNYVYFNSQNTNAETPDGPDYAPMSDEQKKDIEELLKILAPQAAVEFANALDGNTSGAWMRNKKTGARLIRLSVYAKHPHSVAYHEALHDLFQTLREAGHEAAIRVLERVATQANVKRRLAQLLDGEDAAIAQLEDPEEAAAYLFQFWALGYQGSNKPNTMIKGLGPQTESFFQRLWYAIKDVLGWLTEQDKAELIMRSFFHGKLNDPVATKAILDKVEHDAGRYDAAMRPLTKHLNKVFSTADERLRATLDKDMIEIADLFYPSLKGDSRARFFNDRDTEDNLGLFDSVFQMSNKGLAQLHDMVSEMTADDLRSAIDHLQMATKYEDIEAGHVRALVRETHKVLRKYHEYLREAGVLNYDGRPLGDLGASYFPRNWNFDMLVENGSELVADLLKHHMPDLTAIAEKAKENARAKDKDADVSGHEYTPEGVAEYILRKLTDSQGVETLTQDADGKPVGALHESGIDLGFTPLMMAVNSRTLTFLDMKHFHKYLEKDYIKTMSTYATQAVKRAEYTRRFGPSGERIRDALKNAAHSKYLEKARAQWGSDFEKKLSDIKKEAAKAGSEEAEQIAYDKLTRAAFDDFANLDKKFSAESRAYADELAPVIQALEGTLGRDISDTLRAVNSWMMTYQNWRTLPLSLFASFTDPLGIVMKGGSAKQAYKAFVRGVKEVWRTWRGSPTTGADDIEAEMAKMVGALEASALMDALGQTYSSVYMTGKAKKLNDLLFKLNGMEAWNRAMRTQAAVAGIDWLKSAIGTTDTTVLRQIEELGLKPSDLKLSLKNPGMLDMSDKKIQRALMRWINQAILRPNAAQRPVFASNPKTAIFFHLMQYTYSMQKVILGNAFHEARHGNYQPIVTLGVAYTPIAIAAMALRGLIQGGGDEPEWMKGMGPADWLVLGINRAGITGIPGSILENNLNTDIAPIEGENFVTKGIIGAADAAMGTMFPMPAVDQLLDIISPASEKTWDENAVRALPLNAMYRGWFGY